ncbi:MAG: protein kinase [Thermoanaerobaculia bacterium]|nr:protein kinase [Thermoanaerobaculia bacterium]
MNTGELFGSYRLIECIGAGGMGEVWKAEDVKLRRTVAIKILPAASAQDRETNERFKREARTAAQLNHPNIATIHAIDQKDDRAFIVMEYVDGEPLSRTIRSGRMSESEVVGVARGVAEALAEAHDKGIVHRDIKPDNVVVAGSRVKVLDFGIAKRYGHDAGDPHTPKSDTEFRTQAGIIIGTVQYMSPEQAMGKLLDGRSDIFSLGVVMYEALTGRLPFEGDSPALTLTRIIRDDPPHVRATRPGVSPKLSAIVMRCLEKDPVRRYSTARELIDALGTATPAVPDAPVVSDGRSDENAIQTMITTPKPALQSTLKRTPRTVIERHPPREKASVLPWIVAMVAIVIASVVGTAWYLTRNAPISPAAGMTTSAAPASAAAGTEIAVMPPAPEPAGAQVATATIVDMAPAVPATGTSVANATPSPVPPVPIRAVPLLARDDGSGGVGAPPANASNAELADYYYRKGLSHVERRQPLDAYESFQRVVELEPARAAGWVRAGELALALNRPQEAMTDFTKAAQIGKGLEPRDALTAEFGRAIVDGDVAAMDQACAKAPFDRLYNELRRAAAKRGATDCPAPIGVGLEGGRRGGSKPGPDSAVPARPIRRP